MTINAGWVFVVASAAKILDIAIRYAPAAMAFAVSFLFVMMLQYTLVCRRIERRIDLE